MRCSRQGKIFRIKGKLLSPEKEVFDRATAKNKSAGRHRGGFPPGAPHKSSRQVRHVPPSLLYCAVTRGQCEFLPPKKRPHKLFADC